MNAGIYKIGNLVDGKTYIGSSVNVHARKYKHFWMLRTNKHDNSHLQNSYNKFGEENFTFEILELCNSIELIQLENKYITIFKSNESNFGYNLATVNEFRRNTYNDEVKNKLSKYNQKKNGNFEKFVLINIYNENEFVFDNLVDGGEGINDTGISTLGFIF